MNKSTLGVSVIIPVFNRVSMLVRAIESVLAQTYCNFELVVVDDASTVDMHPIIDHARMHGYRYHRCIERGGVSRARNVGCSLTSGFYVAFLDSDDYWMPTKLARQCAAMEQTPLRKWCHTDEYWYHKGIRRNPGKRHVKPDGDAFSRCVELCCVSPSAVLIQRAFLEAERGFDERMSVCEDYDLWLRLASQEPITLISEHLVVKCGGHADQLSRSEPAMDRFRVYSLLKLLREGVLNADQRDEVLRGVVKKAGVIEAGARKRRNHKVAEFFSELMDAARRDMYVADEELLERHLRLSLKRLSAFGHSF